MDTPDDQKSPVDGLNPSDPGDEVQRNFRYQHAYGAILIAACFRGDKEFTAIWCEQHEDFLGEYKDGTFDAIQVKTRQPEQGFWKLNDEEIQKCIRRFNQAAKQFGSKIRSFAIVSNAEFQDSDSKTSAPQSLPHLLRAVRTNSSPAELPDIAKAAFEKLANQCDCSGDDLFKTLKLTVLVKGPERESFEATIAHDHIATVPEWKAMQVKDLNSKRDELIFKVYEASSVTVSDPSKHFAAIESKTHPRLSAKRIGINEMREVLMNSKAAPFRFRDTPSRLLKDSQSTDLTTLELKLIKGGIADQIEVMRRKALDTEAHLLELGYRDPIKGTEIATQLSNLVLSECNEAHSNAHLNESQFGRVMYKDVQDRLKDTAVNRKAMAQDQEYECLMGVAAILTGECLVWWSKDKILGKKE